MSFACLGGSKGKKGEVFLAYRKHCFIFYPLEFVYILNDLFLKMLVEFAIKPLRLYGLIFETLVLLLKVTFVNVLAHFFFPVFKVFSGAHYGSISSHLCFGKLCSSISMSLSIFKSFLGHSCS